MKLKRLSEVSFIDQPSDGANVIIEDNGNLGKAALSGGGSDDQKWHETTSDVLFSETVTTVTEGDYATANLAYSEEITSDVLSVVFNGTEYTCYRNEFGGYGGAYNEADDTYDFSVYPFTIETSMGSNAIFTAEPGTYSISASDKNITYTDAFKKGVAENSTFYVDFEDGDNGVVCNKTISEITTAYEGGANVVGRYDYALYHSYSYSAAPYTFSNTRIDPLNDEVVIREIVLIDTPNGTVIEQYEARVSATIEKISGGGSSPLG